MTVRRAHKVWGGIAAGVFSLVVIGDLSAPGTPTTVAAPAAVTAPAAPVAVPAAAPAAVPVTGPARPAAPVVPQRRTATVTDVVDGDTLVVGGQKVRVLGIDACEAGTDGGEQAIATAETLLEGRQVTLRTQPGVDRDRDGRLLRYVDLSSGADFAESMVVFDHTGVHQGRAPKSYAQQLRDADPNGRSCSAPAPVTSEGDDTDYGDGGSIDWPTPGDQGTPDGALTGGYCKKKWWC